MMARPPPIVPPSSGLNGQTLAERLLALDKAEFDDELAARFGDHYGAVESIGPIGSFPLKLVAATAMTGQRLALVGDAARSIHPIAGQGFNLGLRDSAELARRVADRLALGLDPGAQMCFRATPLPG